ncbi:MAG: hypothetical protein MK081_04655 [Flavobacteriales bacterium]|nr:hypothetical protein [Flavobacteriales bacterium]
MAKARITPEGLLKQINNMKLRFGKIKALDPETLLKKDDEKTWSAAEVVEHMYMGYRLYKPKFEKALASIPEASEKWDHIEARGMANWAINGLAPQTGNKIKYKMKTSKVFQPVRLPMNADQETMNNVFDDFVAGLDFMADVTRDIRTREVKAHRFNSAIGPIVRFNVAEGLQFILHHNERHMIQIDKILGIDTSV